jgi:hypothetical protein
LFTASKNVSGSSSLLGCEDKGFAERMNHGADEKIAAQLDGMRLPGLFADHRYPSRKCLEQRTGTVHGSVGAGCHHPKPTLLRHAWPAKHRRSHKFDAPVARAPR